MNNLNEIEKLLKTIDKKINKNLFFKKYELNNSEFISFKTFCNVDLGINYFYLSTDCKYEYLYYKTTGNDTLYYEALFNQDGSIIWANSHSNMANCLNSNFSLIQISTNIINEFKTNIDNIISKIETCCHHFEKEEIKYPISEEKCHVFSRTEHHQIKNIESKYRINFNKHEQNCKKCDIYTVLDDSHLVSAYNIKNLTINDSKAYYSAKFFDDLKNKPFTSLMTISDNFLNERNRNFQISCFCRDCENSFTKTDKNSFQHIKDVETEILYKSLGVYSQEANYNIKLFEELKNKYNGNHKIYLLNSLTKHRSTNEKTKTDNLLNDLKSNKLNYKLFNLEYDLLKNAFIETVSLSFYKNNFYLIYITNKANKMYVNVFTNDIKFPRDHRWLHNILYATITLNKFCFYSKEFYNDIKNIAYNMIYDYYNNDMEKDLSHPLDITRINYGAAIQNILNKYIDTANYINLKIHSIYKDL